MNNLFVYGTLRNGRLQNFVPEVASFVETKGKGFVNGLLFNAGEFPVAKRTKVDTQKVYGDLLEIKEGKEKDVLRLLDEYEEIDNENPKKSLFVRNLVKVKTNKGEILNAWIYWYNKEVEGLKLIKDGIYRAKKNA